MVDTYTLRARIEPVLLVAFPAAVIAYALGAPDEAVMRLVGAVAAFGVTGLLALIARDRGARLEPSLWESWGGPPTHTMLISSSRNPAPDIERLRRQVRRLLPDVGELSDAHDHDQPDETVAAVDAFVLHLRERTRDRERFPIVFDANVGYGFRRNVLGLRPLGLAVALCCTVTGVVGMVLIALGDLDRSMPAFAATAVVGVIASVLWWSASSAWVRVQADRYGRALLASADALEPIA